MSSDSKENSISDPSSSISPCKQGPSSQADSSVQGSTGGISDERLPDSSDHIQQKGNKTTNGANPPKSKKRKKLRDVTAPKQPLSGYLRFLNDRRDIVRAENPNLSFTDISKMLGLEWKQLPPERKHHYLDEAEQERERYQRDMDAYKQTEAYRLFSEQQEADQRKQEVEFNGFEIPIFTEEFLDHNKGREAELRQLRKSITDYEQQNAILQKHIDTMKAAVAKLETETGHQRGGNEALQKHLDVLRRKLTTSLQQLPLPGTNEKPTLETIDDYMRKVHMLLTNPASPERDDFAVAFRELLAPLDLQKQG